MHNSSVNVWVDEIVPCLKESATQEIKETVVFRIETKSFLEQFNEKTGWCINWSELSKNVEIYALSLKEDIGEIQGLVALQKDDVSQAAFICWACTAPHNNKMNGKQKYIVVGGHLFAIACEKSIEWGFCGAVHGFAANKTLLEHYVSKLMAEPLCMLHQYQFFIDEQSAQQLREVYHYEWRNT